MTRWYRPHVLHDALALLGDGVEPVAGCTDLLVVDHATGRQHEAVLDVTRLPELQGIRVDDQWLDVGAACTFYQIRQDPAVHQHAPILAEVAATIGSWHVQNRATIGGNIVTASPAGDSLPVLLSLDAELVLASRRGERVLSHTDMHVDYRQTLLAPDELVVRVKVPLDSRRNVQLLRKVGTRQAQAISKMVLALTARRTGKTLVDVRFGIGSVAPVPMRLTEAERVVEGQHVSPETASRAADAAAAQIEPIDDVRSTADYRTFVTRQMVRRLVLQAGALG